MRSVCDKTRTAVTARWKEKGKSTQSCDFGSLEPQAGRLDFALSSPHVVHLVQVSQSPFMYKSTKPIYYRMSLPSST